MDWTEKHRPRSLKDVVGNSPAVGRLKAWADSWRTGPPEKRAVVLAGPPGTGKTSTALALANDMAWSVIELNASDARNSESIRRIATAGALHQTFGLDGSFHGGRAAGAASGSAGQERRGASKLIILDEADNLYERGSADDGGLPSELSDKGGKAQIIETIRQSQQPIILIVNDLYALTKGSGSALKTLCEELKFTRVNVRSIPPALARIASLEGVTVDRDVLEAIAAKSEGDLRAATRDLEAICVGRTKVTVQALAALGPRDTTTSMFDLIRHVLKGRRLEDVRREVWDVDATPEDLALWVDENLGKEYKDPHDLVRGYEMLSRADVFLGRTKRTQNYGLWSYAGELATLGVMTARQKEYHGFVPFGFPQWLSRMGRTKGIRGAKDELAVILGRATHASKRKTRTEQVETFATLFQSDREFAVHQTLELELEDEQVALLLGDKATAKNLKELRAEVDALLPTEESKRAERAAKSAKQAGPDGEEEAEAEAGVDRDDDGAPKKPAPAAGQKRLF